ncbi:MAG TPA: GTP-binding protein [Kofleriaceae bacterium]|nr:GTP-binding protein [Kofleriaceae bacterium]
MRVNLLFGFLGSGKTTLARHLLAERAPDVKTAVIVNEFGEVGIDGDILRGDNVDVVELNSGCLCCTLRGSLMLAVEELRDKAKVERVIVEATGVAQPSELLDTLADSSMEEGLDIGPLVTVVDVFKFPKLVSMLGDFYVDQIENADIVLLNKIDLVTPAQLEEATRQVRELNPHADLIYAEQGRVRPEELFEKRAEGLVDRVVAQGVAGDAAAHDHNPDHDHDHDPDDHGHDPHADAPAQSFVVRGSGNATSTGVQRFFGALPDNVWRAKGFVHIDGRPSLVQYSLGQLEITPAESAQAEAIVFIGNGMDRAAIESGFAQARRP